MGIIFNIQKFCIHDGDGIRTCVFLKGCPLRCVWCHNPESLEKSQTLSFDSRKCSSCGKCVTECNARSIEDGTLRLNRTECIKCGKCEKLCLNGANKIIGRETTAREIIAEVVKDRIFYETSGGGMTVTGGEPSYQPEFTLEILRLAKEEGISSAIETSGIGPIDFYRQVADMGTTFLFDIKCIDSKKHKKLTGADNNHIMSNLSFLMDSGADIILRLPLIPGCNDSDEDIEKLCDFLNKNKGRYRYAEIMPYHSLGTAKAGKTGLETDFMRENATKEEISRWLTLFDSHGTQIKVSE